MILPLLRAFHEEYGKAFELQIKYITKMARQKSPEYTLVTGRIGNKIYSAIGKGWTGVRMENTTQAPLQEDQKKNASGFSELNRHVKFLNLALRESFPPDSKGVKWANRFTSVNKKNAEVITTTKIDPDTPVDPKKKSNEEFASQIDWSKVIMAQGPLWKPVVTVNASPVNAQQILEFKRKQLTLKGASAKEIDAVKVDANATGYKLQFEQTPNAIEGAYAYNNDLVRAIIYNPENGFCLQKELRLRGEGGATSELIPAGDGIELADYQVYVYAKTANGKRTSNSVYLTVTIES